MEQENTGSATDGKDQQLVTKWLARIKREKRLHRDARDSGKLAWDTFQNNLGNLNVCYPLLWSVTQIQHSAVYSSQPIPDIRSRNSQGNKLYDHAADVMQRALEFYLDQTNFDEQMNRTVDDFLVAGLGVARVKLDATIVETEAKDQATGQPLTGSDGKPQLEPIITDQMVRIEHHPWNRFGWEPCGNWDHCEWIYFEHELTAAQIRRRWGEDVEIPTQDSDYTSNKRDRQRRLHSVYEIWDKRNRKMLVVGQGISEPLAITDDPLKLDGFFPMPQPVMTNVPSDECEFCPDYHYYQEQDAELQRLYKRARVITEEIKATSLHDASIVELKNWKELEDGASIPVKNLIERMEGGPDIRKLMMFWPLEERVQSLQVINEQIAAKRAHVDDLLGIADVLRGSSNPQDGVDTNVIKERWAGIRLRRKQTAIQAQIRGLFRLMAELTVEHITPDNLSRMTQIEITPELEALLKDDTTRTYAVDVESDSTVAKDETQDKRQRTELLAAITQWVQVVAPAVAQNLIPADLGREILSVATDPYKKFSRTLDDTISQLPDTQKQLAGLQQMQQQLQGVQQENEQLKYALQQYSQAEEARQDTETNSTANLKTAQAEKTRAEIPATSLDPMIDQADIGETVAKTEKIRHDMANPPPPRGLMQ